MEGPGQENVYRNVKPLLRPKSITIVGASEKPTSWSARIFRNLRNYGFPGDIHLVNPRHRTLYNAPCFPSISDVPSLDQLVVIIPAQRVPGAIEEGGRRGCRSAVIFSGGFSESGAPGATTLERDLVSVANQHGVILCGPNCLGNVSTKEKVLTFAERMVDNYSGGGLALVSQSSGLMGGVMRHAHTRGLGLSYCIASGSEANTDAADYLNFLVEDPGTHVLGLFLEAIRRPQAFARACEKARVLKKPILILKLGKSRKGRDSVATHTGALAGSYEAFVALCRKYGLIEIRGFAECVDTAELFLRSPLPKTRGVAALSLSGGGKGYLHDLAEELNLSFPEPSLAISDQLVEVLGLGSAVGNPLDLGAGGAESLDAQLRCVELLGSDASVGLIAFQSEMPQGPESGARVAGLKKMIDRAAEMGKPIVFYSRAGYPALPTTAEPAKQLNAPFLQDIRRSFQAIGHVMEYFVGLDRGKNGRSAEKSTTDSRPAGVNLASACLSDHEAFALLEKSGITVARYALSAGKDATLQAAERIGYPVAVKASVTGLTHKNQSGGVRLNLQGASDVLDAFDSIQNATARLTSSLTQVLVQEMVRGGLELYVGGRWDPEFGPLILFGFGGIFVEDLARVCTRLAPVEEWEAEQMISDSGVGRALRRLGLEPCKGHGPIIEAVVKMSQLIARNREVDSIEVNPLLFLDDKRPCVAVDVVSLRQS